MSRRIAFLGTPSFALPALEHLADRSDAEVVLVVTQPDRPAGRGQKHMAPAVKSAALDLGLPIYQTSTLRDADARAPLIDARPDLIVVAAFGLILGKSILSLPPLGCVNLHASLLPRYRGANPIAAAILSGDAITGVSLMHMNRGLDTGAIYAQQVEDITIEDTTETLTDRLSHLGASLVADHLSELLGGKAVLTEQASHGTCTRPMTKDDGWIDWTRPAVEIERHVRAMWPWPRAWTTLPDGTKMQVHSSKVIAQNLSDTAGTVVYVAGGVAVQCGEHVLHLDRLQLAGGKPIDGQMRSSRFSTTTAIRVGQIGAPGIQEPLVSECQS